MSIGTLYVVGTPLGNLGDLSERAGDVLRTVDIVAAEDTRRTRTLLAHASAQPTVLSFHAHSAPQRLDQLSQALRAGRSVALVTDAGTPGVSDPGAALVRRAHELGAPVRAVPGPSAVAAALSVSGLPADRYVFVGFVPRRGRERARALTQITASPWTSVIFESPNRLAALLSDLRGHAGPDRPAVVARELTKVYEEVKSGTLNELAVYYGEHTARGEVTVLVGGSKRASPVVDPESVKDRAREWIGRGLSRRDAADRVAEEFEMSRRDAYRVVTEL